MLHLHSLSSGGFCKTFLHHPDLFYLPLLQIGTGANGIAVLSAVVAAASYFVKTSVTADIIAEQKASTAAQFAEQKASTAEFQILMTGQFADLKVQMQQTNEFWQHSQLFIEGLATLAFLVTFFAYLYALYISQKPSRD